MMLSEEHKAELATRIRNLLAELDDALAEREQAGRTVELDQTRQGRLSRMDALQGQAMAQAAAGRARLRLAQLEHAAQRLQDDPDFGLCIDCDEPIPWPRLQLDPCARRCTACAQEAER